MGNRILQGANSNATSQVLQAESFEVVDKDGNVTASLSSNRNGGTLTLFRIGDDGEGVRFAWLGCSFPGGAEMTLRDPKGEGETLLMLSVDGEPMSASVSATGVNGDSVFSIGSRAKEFPVFNGWSAAGQSQSDK
ncbi:MAG: hypothetical protein JKX88_10255 [Marinicaulis sp.]|nr:hypothetical protein [Marinicaulis sp.]